MLDWRRIRCSWPQNTCPLLNECKLATVLHVSPDILRAQAWPQHPTSTPCKCVTDKVKRGHEPPTRFRALQCDMFAVLDNAKYMLHTSALDELLRCDHARAVANGCREAASELLERVAYPQQKV